jgi:hypothetical protein
MRGGQLTVTALPKELPDNYADRRIAGQLGNKLSDNYLDGEIYRVNHSYYCQ